MITTTADWRGSWSDPTGAMFAVMGREPWSGRVFHLSEPASGGAYQLWVVQGSTGPLLRIRCVFRPFEEDTDPVPTQRVCRQAMEWLARSRCNEIACDVDLPLGRTLARLERISGVSLRPRIPDELLIVMGEGWLVDYDRERRRQVAAEENGCGTSEIVCGYQYREGTNVPQGLLSWLAFSRWEWGCHFPSRVEELQELFADAALGFCPPAAQRLRMASSYFLVARWARDTGIEFDRVRHEAQEWADRLICQADLAPEDGGALRVLAYLHPKTLTPELRRAIEAFHDARGTAQWVDGDVAEKREGAMESADDEPLPADDMDDLHEGYLIPPPTEQILLLR